MPPLQTGFSNAHGEVSRVPLQVESESQILGYQSQTQIHIGVCLICTSFAATALASHRGKDEFNKP